MQTKTKATKLRTIIGSVQYALEATGKDASEDAAIELLTRAKERPVLEHPNKHALETMSLTSRKLTENQLNVMEKRPVSTLRAVQFMLKYFGNKSDVSTAARFIDDIRKVRKADCQRDTENGECAEHVWWSQGYHLEARNPDGKVW